MEKPLKPLDQSLIRKALRHLKSSDRVLAALIEEHATCTITHLFDNPYHALVSSIISHQFSASAAKAMKGGMFHSLGFVYD